MCCTIVRRATTEEREWRANNGNRMNIAARTVTNGEESEQQASENKALP